MIPLTALAFIGAVIFLERLLYLHKGQIKAIEFVDGIKAALKKHRLLEAITICDETYGPIPRIIKTALINSEEKEEILGQAVSAAAQNEFALLDRRVSSIATIAKIAPIMALLQVFYIMGQSGNYATASEFSMSVYNALISTAMGLFIAALGWLGYSFLNSRVRALAHDIDWSANEILLFIMRGMPADENLHLKGKLKE